MTGRPPVSAAIVSAEFQSADAVWEAVCALPGMFGLEGVGYEFVPFGSLLGRKHSTMRECGLSACFEGMGEDAALLRDALFRRAFLEVPPFRWSDLPGQSWLAQDRERIARLVAACAKDMLTVPVYGPHIRNGYFVFGIGAAAVPAGPVLRDLQQACQTLHLRLAGFEEDPFTDPIKLSGRERDVLTWLARGKSNAETGEILGISANTVDSHLRRIYAKFGVNDRVSIAVLAMATGLIH